MKNNISFVVENQKCTNCFNCLSVCPKKAISKSHQFGHVFPNVDNNLCIDCGMCLKKCHVVQSLKEQTFEKDYYVGYFNSIIANRSSSGGIATAASLHIIDDGGVVFGSTISLKNDSLSCFHMMISDKEDIKLIQGSKYLDSKVDLVFPEVKEQLSQSKKVLFIGCSCHVSSLNLYIEDNLKDNLFTIDLVCHGVPCDSLFDNYVKFLESKYRGKIIDISFRKRNNYVKKERHNYCITVTILKNKKNIKKEIKLRASAYYRLFMARAGYRPSCYNCKYASINKPSDITLGDFYSKNTHGFDPKQHLSFIMVNTAKGKELLNSLKDIELARIDEKEAIETHEQLKLPSKTTDIGLKMLSIYSKEGYKGLQKYIAIRNSISWVPSLIKRILK